MVQHSTATGIRTPVSDLTPVAGNSKSAGAIAEFHSDTQIVSCWVENSGNGTAILYYYSLNNNETKIQMLKNSSLNI